jgi:methyl-accepting chemotaxis protein
MDSSSPGAGLRIPIFWRILGSCLLLSGLLIALSYAYARYRTSQQSRGQFMRELFRRYQSYQDARGHDLYAVTDVVAEDETFRKALSPATGPTAPDALAAAAQRAGELHEMLGERQSIRPDLFIVFDTNGGVVFIPEGSPIGRDDLTALQVVAKVRSGMELTSFLLHKNRIYQIAGAPIRAWGKKDVVVGGMVIGVDLDRYLDSYADRSAKDTTRQDKLTLVRGHEVLASAFPDADWQELATVLQKENRKIAPEGGGTDEMVLFGGTTWDVHEEEISGYAGPDLMPHLATLSLLRDRSRLRAPEGFGFAAIAGGVLALVIASILALWITRPLKKFIAATAEIAAGGADLTKRLPRYSNDEIGDLARNLNRLFDHLHELARGVQAASTQVASSSAEISAASKQMLEGARHQAGKVEGSTAAVTELSASIQQMAGSASNVTKAATQSNELVSAAVDKMAQIRCTVVEARDRILELGASGKRIGGIVEVIRQISEQTSLLALNASIEAAHAGDQGRGFAVVADEVSSLAKRVGTSARDIEELIARLSDQTAAAVTAMGMGTKEVEGGTKLVSATLSSLKEIIDSVRDTATAVQEQALASDEIARNMDDVRAVANEVVQSSEAAALQSDQLFALAHKLEDSVRGFKVAEAPPAPPHRQLAPLKAVDSGRGERM